jgi:hypothetical protein
MSQPAAAPLRTLAERPVPSGIALLGNLLQLDRALAADHAAVRDFIARLRRASTS